MTMENGLGSYACPVRERDLISWEAIIRDANRVAEEDRKRNRDEGTCVLGAGVAVWTLPHRARRPVRKILVHAPFQGNVGSQKACARSLEIIQQSGLDGAVWYDGVMD